MCKCFFLSLQAEEELKETCARQVLQLREMGRRERLLRAELGQGKEQVGRRGASPRLGWRQQKCRFSHGEEHCG